MAKHKGELMVSVGLMILVAACGSDTGTVTTATPSAAGATTSTSTASTTTTTTPATTTPVPDPTTGRTAVSGTTTCTRTGWTSETQGTNEIVYEHFVCVEEMSDPRVSGVNDYDIETVFLTECHDNPAAPWTAEVVLSNEGGSWRGTCTGALDYTTYPSGAPMNYGICTLAGEGDYAGLTYVLMGAGGNEGLVQAGWIEPAS